MVAVLFALTLVLAACGDDDPAGGGSGEEAAAGAAPGDPPDWPAPSNPLELSRAAGLVPEVREQLRFHRHAHLDVFFNGDTVLVPSGIGIDITDPAVMVFHDDPLGPGYGGIVEPCDDPCISPLHTHDFTGTLHTESATSDLSTLGQFFIEWGVRLDDGCVGDYCSPDVDLAFYVNGEEFDGDPTQIGLADLTEIAVVIGTPPAEIPAEGQMQM
jgi:hypothetical protein